MRVPGMTSIVFVPFVFFLRFTPSCSSFFTFITLDAEKSESSFTVSECVSNSNSNNNNVKSKQKQKPNPTKPRTRTCTCSLACTRKTRARCAYVCQRAREPLRNHKLTFQLASTGSIELNYVSTK